MKWLLALLLLAAPARAEEVWAGFYRCAQGQTQVTLTFEVGAEGTASALFHFYADKYLSPNVPEGCFTMTGHVDRATGRVDPHGERWLLHPDGYVTVDLHGSIQPGNVGGFTDEKNLMLGTVSGPGCSDFLLLRPETPPFGYSRSPSPCYGAPSS